MDRETVEAYLMAWYVERSMARTQNKCDEVLSKYVNVFTGEKVDKDWRKCDIGIPE